ncbi:MAG: peptide-methionine (R)-S-oxide reductase MsrB [Actinomycetia bacterium]|nr:peptide-methionine (R)-S-oxide reductase MsrB [Actinomycetes bacterium]
MKVFIIIIILISLIWITGCTVPGSSLESDGATEQGIDKDVSITKEEKSIGESKMIIPDYKNSRYKEIYLAGGCFWGVQAYIDQIIGVEYTNAGYANGETGTTDYYSIGKTGHAETVYVAYDPKKLTLEELIGYYYQIIDPTSLDRQGNDIGSQYRSGIYYVDEEDKEIIELITEKEQAKYDEEIVTEIEPLTNYVLAEDYHQDYLQKNPGGYCHIDLSQIPKQKPSVNPGEYPKPSVEEIKKELTDLQFRITQEDATELAFQNEYWDNKEDGLYVDIVTGEPLFLSSDKYDSGTGWPSFTRPIQWDVLTHNSDNSGGMEIIEVRSRSGDSHLGHLFYDGPAEEGGLRYCINSGALDFISLDEFEEKGYGKFKILFE